MSERTGSRIKLLFAVLLSISLGFSQARQAPQRSAPARGRAPFLQQAKFYDETPYVTKVVFKNGMTVLVNEYRAQPVVSIQAYVHAGFSRSRPRTRDWHAFLQRWCKGERQTKAWGHFDKTFRRSAAFSEAPRISKIRNLGLLHHRLNGKRR